MNQRYFGALACAGLLLGMSSPAHALFGDDEARKAILDLRERMETVQNGQLLLQTQIDQLREQNAQLIGRIEQLSNNLAVQQRSMKDLYADLNDRVAVFEPSDVMLDGEVVKVTPEERRLYDLGVRLFTQEKYDQSAEVFNHLATLRPDSPYAASALFWRGNALYAAGDLQHTVEVMKDLEATFPKSKRVPDAQLTRAAALTGLDKRSEALTLLRSIVKNYAGTETAKLAQQRIQALERRTNKKSKK